MSDSSSAIPSQCHLDPRIELRPSSRGDQGLFARAPISEGETLIIWGGPSYTDVKGAQAAVRAGKTCMQWDRNLFSVDVGDDNIAFRINHSCDPNVWMQGAFTLVARREILENEEIVADYALWESSEDDIAAWDCQWGSPLCRGRITGRDWRLRELQRRYRGHFSPLLNARIDQQPLRNA